jgi:hypothetical protein
MGTAKPNRLRRIKIEIILANLNNFINYFIPLKAD